MDWNAILVIPAAAFLEELHTAPLGDVAGGDVAGNLRNMSKAHTEA
jgi:hypothetical protein